MAAKKKAATKSVSKKLYLYFAYMNDVDSIDDFNSTDANIYTTLDEAIDNIDNDSGSEYIVEVEIKSVKTNRVVSAKNLIEIKLK